MTNAQGLYFCLAITFIVGFIIVYVVVKRNKDGDFNKTVSETVVKNPYAATLLYPLFILLGIAITAVVLFFH